MPDTSLLIEEDEIVPQAVLDDDDPIHKLPKRLKKYILFPNWKDDSRGMFDKTRCGSNGIFCYPFNRVVKEGQLALVWDDGVPRIYGPGLHQLCCFSPGNVKIGSLRDDFIKHGPLHIITVAQGKLGYGLEKGITKLLAPGRHKIRSNEFQWNGCLDLSSHTIKIGSWVLVRVDFGRVGVASISGKMKILDQGHHLFEPPDVFIRFVNTRVQILQLPQCVQESSDYVPLSVKANISYCIKDPLKCIERIQDQKADYVITEVSNSAIAAIIRSSTLGDMAMSAGAEIKGKAGDVDRQEGETFHEKMHSKFMATVGQKLLAEFGIQIENINIEQLRIKDANLANQISAQAVKISELEAQHKTLQKEGEVKRQQAQIEKDVLEAKAEADYIVTAKKAEASKLKSLAEAEAESEGIKLKSEAQVEAYIRKSKAEAEHAERMGQSELHKHLAVLAATLDPQVKALSGVKQIAYVPHLPGLLRKPGGIFADVNGVCPPVPDLTSR